MNQPEFPCARILADCRKENPIIEDQLYNEPQYEFLDSHAAHHANKFLIREVDATEKLLLEFGLQGHPGRTANFRIRDDKPNHIEYRNLYVEVDTVDHKELRPIEMLREVCLDWVTFFEQLQQQLTDKGLTDTTNFVAE